MIFPYPSHVRDWLNRMGKCHLCGQLYSEPPCEKSDHYRTCIDLSYQFLREQVDEDELNQPEEEMELIA